MKSTLPKALHKLAGRPLINRVIDSVTPLGPQKIIVVISPPSRQGGQDIAQEVAPHETVIQESPRGTGDAVKAALATLEDFNGDVLILLGDMPLISTETLQALIDERYQDTKTGISVLGAKFDKPPAFGRLLLGTDGALSKIVEDKDCNADQRSIKLCNMGAFCVDGIELPKWAARLENNNAAGEFYITDLVEIAAKDNVKSHTYITHNQDEIRGVNARADLAELENIVQEKLRAQAMENGATLIDPASVYFSWDTELGTDVVIEPNVFFGPGVKIADNVHIKAFSHIEDSTIKAGAHIGPFARLRQKTTLEEDVRIGTFVEVNKSTIGRGTKAMHQTYLGMATIGESCNIGAGTITCNYDGVNKHETALGNNVFIGSNSNLVAPVTIHDDAFVAAGSTITKDVPAGALAVARAKSLIKNGWATARRKKKSA